MSSSLIASALVSGLVNGALYALLGLAVILIFRTTAVANFAQGEVGMLSAFAFLMFILPVGLPFWAAWLATLAFGALCGAATYLVLLRVRPAAGHLNLTVRTLGLYTLVYAAAVYWWGEGEPYRVPSLFGPTAVSLAGFNVSQDQLGTMGVALVLAAVFLLFFRFTRVGLAMRAVAINADVAALQGVDVRRVVLLAWMVACALSAAVALLVAPTSFLGTDLMRPYLLKAFTAAILGGMYSFPGVLVGGVILGLSESLAAMALSIHFRETFVFVVLLLVLLLRPAGIFGSVQRVRV
ncbi:branched-chain amino acid ABC transporter permease [Pseudorhodoferax sp.]|uniref:branched-chain amino acid ABC transporter permease n=1 Tax=Pseudorhodoferax sp. TaxID=1993553 RepID=UPI002DD678B8|nr:branched-chain amino acid ABC transporter permease [Pseudorhodoferax sp.]